MSSLSDLLVFLYPEVWGLEFNVKTKLKTKLHTIPEPPPAQGKVPAVIPKIPTNQSPCQSITPIRPHPQEEPGTTKFATPPCDEARPPPNPTRSSSP